MTIAPKVGQKYLTRAGHVREVVANRETEGDGKWQSPFRLDNDTVCRADGFSLGPHEHSPHDLVKLHEPE